MVSDYPHCCTDFVKPNKGPHWIKTSLRLYYFLGNTIPSYTTMIAQTLDENLAVLGPTILH